MTAFLACRECLTVTDLALAFHDPPDGVIFLTGAIEHGFRLLELLGGNDHQHADAHVEGAHHVVMRNIAELLHVREDGRHGPGSKLDYRRNATRQNPWQVFGDASSGNVRHRRHTLRSDKLLRYTPIATMRLHQLVA